MDVRAIFGIDVLASFVSSAIAARLFVWPWLRGKGRYAAPLPLVAPHMFLRFIGMSLLVPGVVSPALPASFAIPAAYGDFAAGILAIIATIALAKRARWAIPVVWVFNLWGAADLLLAFYNALYAGIRPGMFGPAFYLPTAIVPNLLMSHIVIFGLLLRAAAPLDEL